MGFSDAESNFIINRIIKKEKTTNSNRNLYSALGNSWGSFSFMFKITLHKDDEMVLRYIHKKLGIGGVRLYKDECIFNVTDRKGVCLLIDIFDKYNLNTTKYLDYLDFKKAFIFYSNRSKGDQVKDYILELKNKMNTNRIHFERPINYEINITKS